MKITEHFTKEELEISNTAIRLGLSNVCPPELVPNMLRVATALELIRSAFGKPVRVLSCYRAPAVNAAVGGSATSAHRFALAADIQIPNVSVMVVSRWCAENLDDYDQVIYEFGETGWTHLGFTDKTPRHELLSAKKVGSKTVYSLGI